MTWTRHHAEIGEACARTHSHSSHVAECLRVFLRDSASRAASDDLCGCVVSWGLGCLIFPLCLGVFQVGVFKPLSITASHAFAPVCGLCSIMASGVAASLAALLTYRSQIDESRYTELDVSFSDVMCYGLGTAAIFKLLRGQFCAVLPSTILKPGAFARAGIPATKSYASSGKKARLAAIGSRHGCHTCGKRWTAKAFIADHQPPLSVPKKTDVLHTLSRVFYPRQPDYHFYPQCRSCSVVQQTYLRAMSAQRNGDLAPGKAVRIDFNHVVTHATSLRLYHLYLPLPVLLAAAIDTCVG